jgi:hypothetical protein
MSAAQRTAIAPPRGSNCSGPEILQSRENRHAEVSPKGAATCALQDASAKILSTPVYNSVAYKPMRRDPLPGAREIFESAGREFQFWAARIYFPLEPQITRITPMIQSRHLQLI